MEQAHDDFCRLHPQALLYYGVSDEVPPQPQLDFYLNAIRPYLMVAAQRHEKGASHGADNIEAGVATYSLWPCICYIFYCN